MINRWRKRGRSSAGSRSVHGSRRLLFPLTTLPLSTFPRHRTHPDHISSVIAEVVDADAEVGQQPEDDDGREEEGEPVRAKVLRAEEDDEDGRRDSHHGARGHVVLGVQLDAGDGRVDCTESGRRQAAQGAEMSETATVRG